MTEKCIYVVDVGDAHMRGGVHCSGTTVELEIIETPKATLATSGEENLLRGIEDIVGRLGRRARPMDALGVSASGMIRLESRPDARSYGPFADHEPYVNAPNVDGLNDFPLLTRLEALGWDVPIHIENDVNASLESVTGRDDAICVSLGAGLGASVKRNGAVVHPFGTWSCQEVGHGIRWNLRGDLFRECHCGNRGCLEAVVGGWAMAARYGVAPENASEALYNEMRDEVVVLLPPAIAHLVEATGITQILLAGRAAHGYFGDFAQRERLRLATEALDASARQLTMQPIALGEAAELHGVALALLRHTGVDSLTHSQI